MISWPLLDQVLGISEVILLPVSLLWLASRALRGRSVRWPVLLVAALGLTLAQPFGAKFAQISPRQYAAGHPVRADAEQVHSVRILGLPVVGFRAYAKKIFYVDRTVGQPESALKVRSWIWPGILANGSTLVRMCGRLNEPCWVPGDHATPLGTPSNLELVEADGEWRFALRSGGLSGTGAKAEDTRRQSRFYRLTIGIASPLGAGYWLVAAALGAVALSRRARITSAASGPASDGRCGR